LPIWSSLSIPGKPSIAIVDGSQDRNSWESQFCVQLFGSLKRSGLQMYGECPLAADILAPVKDPEKFNSLLLCAQDPFDFWPQTKTQSWFSQKLFCFCSWQNYDPQISTEMLQSQAAAVVVPESQTTAREAGLFYLKFFTELNLHSVDQISGKMIWFSFAKAKELLKKRRYNGKFTVRC